MRVGQNPAKFVDEVHRPERVTVAVLSYIPFLSGYFAQGLDVLKLCLGSLWENTRTAYDLLVFDNGSGPETVSYLQEMHARGRIQYLLLSQRNVGKGGAWDFMFGAAPGEIVAYADGDVYFEPGWLDAALKIVEAYPQTGMVTCRPMRTAVEFSSSSLAWAQREPGVRVERGSWVAWPIFREHDLGLGQSERDVRRRFDTTEDVRLQYHGQTALVGAVHWQFVSPRKVLQALLPLSLDRPMGVVNQLDERMNQAGYLRLMTEEALVRHMGNTVPSDVASVPPGAGPQGSSRLRDWSPVRRILLWIHNTIFRWYNRGG